MMLKNSLSNFEFNSVSFLRLKWLKALKNITTPPNIITEFNILFISDLFFILSLVVNLPAVKTSTNHQIMRPVNTPRIKKGLFMGLIFKFDKCSPVNITMNAKIVVGFARDIKNVEVNALNNK